MFPGEVVVDYTRPRGFTFAPPSVTGAFIICNANRSSFLIVMLIFILIRMFVSP